jgi:exopolysaccharide production protein ExoZ
MGLLPQSTPNGCAQVAKSNNKKRHNRTMARPKIDFLPGIQYLRGFAALYVVIYHVNGDFDLPFFAYGYLGVQLFFVISGFIITYMHGHDRGLDNLAHFFRRRFTRIYPVYWVALLPVILIFLLLPEKGLAWHREPLNIMRNFLLIQDPNQSILGVAWSLVYEIMFYTLFGLWVIGLGRSVGWLVSGWAALLLILPRLAPPGIAALIFVNSYNFYFLAGCALALLYPFVQVRVGLGYLLAALLLFLLTPFVYNGFWAIFGASLLLCSVAVLYQPTRPQRLWLLLGDASYSIYLTHLTIVALVTTVFKQPWIMAPLFLFCVVGGLGFYYGVENTLRHWLKLRWRQPAAGVAASHFYVIIKK